MRLTVVIVALAASACSAAPAETVATTPPPTTVGACDPAAVATELGTGPEADVVVVFRNDGPVECDVDLGEEWASRYEVEPSVWLAPGATAELWGDCTGTGAATWEVVVNGEPRSIALAGPCTVTPTAFFPR